MNYNFNRDVYRDELPVRIETQEIIQDYSF